MDCLEKQEMRQIKVKDEEAQTFIQSRLNDAGITATVEINTTT